MIIIFRPHCAMGPIRHVSNLNLWHKVDKFLDNSDLQISAVCRCLDVAVIITLSPVHVLVHYSSMK